MPVELERDEFDTADGVIHVLGTVDGAPVAAARIRAVDTFAKVQRVAVLPAYRGYGYGAQIMLYLIELARAGKVASGLNAVVLDSQVSAIGFYETLGFVAEGPEFMDAGIAHRRMTCALGSRQSRQV